MVLIWIQGVRIHLRADMDFKAGRTSRTLTIGLSHMYEVLLPENKHRNSIIRVIVQQMKETAPVKRVRIVDLRRR